MKYALLICDDESSRRATRRSRRTRFARPGGGAGPRAPSSVVAAPPGGGRDHRAGTQRRGAGLRRPVRRDQGPSAASLVECADLDEAIEVAAGHPMRAGGASRCGRSGNDGARRPGSRGGRGGLPRRVGQVVATLIRITGDWDLAEECAQDAFAAALGAWPRDGVPRRPGRLAHHDGPQPRDRPAAPGSAGAPSCGSWPCSSATRTSRRTRRSRTTGCG